MTIDGQKGEKFEDYVDSLEAVNASRGYFTVHNARTKVDNFLDRKVMKSETGEPGAYCCYLRYLHNNQIAVYAEKIASRKQEALNLCYLEFAEKMFATGLIPAARA
ncbi:hypothetical protein DAPPUDRAFT_107214 [Daphnia pulex]|uniref:Uncharacterized protein n=1 Tax=Daphnia pulex TaxID=6669 RepID=E9GWC5_DAPPU|nr:hypothetical protein DAPPUDRAFT_107214 [Daphnia pulex]|eukprot:EFX76214.1 hypothetical protein DAPPUDRAFT_107214 [Daphnia pulex]